MRKLVLCLFYALCAFAIAFSLFWMSLPKLTLPSPAPSGGDVPDDASRSLSAQAAPSLSYTAYYLCDEGGMLTVYACGADGEPADRLEETGIYVNLLPENDALRIKQGLAVYSETELRTVLEDLGE